MLLNSKINKKPLFFIEKFYKKKKTKERYDLTDEDKFIQASFLNFKKGKRVSPHMHLSTLKKTNISQESWIVISGKLKVKFYDLDKSFVHEDILNKGDLSILFQGGHELEALTKNTTIFEIKNGPYMGPKKEKENFKK
jgi:cupin fold WbuC family metalloprotein